ncbi:MAG: hypothetical protein LBD81_02000, partial [Holosporaceae bacterium]|nr:hypothetical protein [Holosporaceae bacterium]
VFDIAKAKSEIFEGAKPPEITIIPKDSPYTDFLENKARKHGIKNIYSFGSSDGADAQLLSYDCGNDRIYVKAKILDTLVDYELRCCNISTVHNSIMALLAVHLISKIPLTEITALLPSFKTLPGRGEMIILKNCDIMIIDDSYNASPTSMKSAIMSLSKRQCLRKIAVLGDMLELGAESAHLHENLAPAIDKFGIDLVFACGEMSRCLFYNLTERKRGCWCETSAELADKVLNEIKNGDCLLIKGSNPMKMNIIVEAIRRRCSEIAA